MNVAVRRLLVGAAGLVAIGAGAAVLPAQASLTDDTVVSANPANVTPNVEDGAVTSIAKVGNTMVAVGHFTSVTDLHGVPFARTNIFAFDANTGEVSTTFVPAVNGDVNRVVSAGEGSSVFIGGEFNQVNAQNASHVARLDVTTGEQVPGFRAASTNGVVRDMVLNNGRLYIGGAFKTVAGKPRTLLAALNPATGADTNTVGFTFTDVFNSGSPTIKALDVSADGSRVVVIGNFRNVDGQSRLQIAMLDTDVSPATLDPWSTTRFDHQCAAQAFDSYMRDVSISPDNDYFVVATTGAFDGGVNNNTLCDTISRWELRSSAPNQQPSWVNYSGGDTFYAVSAIGRIIYVGGHQRWVNNPYAADRPGAGAVDREGIAAFDARNGLPFSWNPGRARGVGLREFLPVDNGLWVAHDTKRLGNEIRKRVAFLPLAGGRNLSAENVGVLPGDVYTAGQLSGGNAVARHPISDAGSTGPEQTVADASGEQWGQARGAFMVDGVVYYGQSDGTFQSRTFDGTTFGPEARLDLNPARKNGTNIYPHTFMADLPNVTGMFYDKTSARLYYTLAGQSQLYYRYFLPESGIVGAVKMVGPAAPTGLNWSKVSGMFLTGGELYVADPTTSPTVLLGTLRKVTWSNGAPSGAAVVVPTPNHDWRIRATFLFAS